MAMGWEWGMPAAHGHARMAIGIAAWPWAQAGMADVAPIGDRRARGMPDHVRNAE
jgi:hypothetical protein